MFEVDANLKALTKWYAVSNGYHPETIAKVFRNRRQIDRRVEMLSNSGVFAINVC